MLNRIPNRPRGRITHSLRAIDERMLRELTAKGANVFSYFGKEERIVARVTMPMSGRKSFYVVTDLEQVDLLKQRAEARNATLDLFWSQTGYVAGAHDYIQGYLQDTVRTITRRPRQQ